MSWKCTIISVNSLRLKALIHVKAFSWECNSYHTRILHPTSLPRIFWIEVAASIKGEALSFKGDGLEN
jgi:hypothetical protein